MPQFRAFNDSDIPIIIFNEELVSASHFLAHNLRYLHFQAGWGSLLHGSPLMSIEPGYFRRQMSMTT
ncbi:hypothetical protein PM082_016753 [Marasmius tenuissimus]|nr:hypothetical protein PM082_016753 [Marasmius tenuissimus]